jgi:hypothetical protein
MNNHLDEELHQYLLENKDNPLFVKAIEKAHGLGVDDGELNYKWAWDLSSDCSY